MLPAKEEDAAAAAVATSSNSDSNKYSRYRDMHSHSLHHPHQHQHEYHQPRCGEVAGETAANCAAVCCCCPLVLLDFLLLLTVKLPVGLLQRIKRRRSRTSSSSRSSSSVSGSGSGSRKAMITRPLAQLASHDALDLDYMLDNDPGTSTARHQSLLLESLSPDALELEKEMRSKFYGAGFWRSISQRSSTSASASASYRH